MAASASSAARRPASPSLWPPLLPEPPPVPAEAVTVKVTAGLVMPPEVAEICALPVATAVAAPVLEPMVATLEFDEDHTALAVRFCVLLSL